MSAKRQLQTLRALVQNEIRPVRAVSREKANDDVTSIWSYHLLQV